MRHFATDARVHLTIQFLEERKLIEKSRGLSRNVRSRGALAQLARASALQAECQGFESLRLHHFRMAGAMEENLERVRRDLKEDTGRIAQLVRARP